MPRQPKPYFRKQTQSWYFSTGGKQYALGKDKEEAFRKFHELMADKDVLPCSVSTLYELSQLYLDWCQLNRKPTTYDRHLHYLKSFIGHVGKKLKIAALKPHHLTKWVQSHDTWNSTSQNDAIGIVQRMLNWALEQGHILRSPIPRVTKPKRQRREIFYTDEQWAQICEHVNDGFIDLLDFMWDTGCSPKEARTLEARHVQLEHDLCLFTHKEAKGEEVERVIFLTDRSRAIVTRLITVHPEGPLFRNSRGNAWTKDSIKCRLTRIRDKVGFRVSGWAICVTKTTPTASRNHARQPTSSAGSLHLFGPSAHTSASELQHASVSTLLTPMHRMEFSNQHELRPEAAKLLCRTCELKQQNAFFLEKEPKMGICSGCDESEKYRRAMKPTKVVSWLTLRAGSLCYGLRPELGISAAGASEDLRCSGAEQLDSETSKWCFHNQSTICIPTSCEICDSQDARRAFTVCLPFNRRKSGNRHSPPRKATGRSSPGW